MISEAQPGQRIRTPVGYEVVFGVPHRTAMRLSTYIQVKSGNFSSHLSPKHYIFVNGEEKLAEDVEVGDVVTTTLGDQRVDDVDVVFKGGKNLILTWSGSYFLDGVAMSTNTAVGVPRWIPNLLRYFYGMRYNIFGIPYAPVSQQVCDVTQEWKKWVVEYLLQFGAPQVLIEFLDGAVACFVAFTEPVNAFMVHSDKAVLTMAFGLVALWFRRAQVSTTGSRKAWQ